MARFEYVMIFQLTIKQIKKICSRTRPTQKKKQGFWNGYAILELRV